MGALGLLLAALGAILERHAKIIEKIDAKNDRFGVPKGSQNETKIGPKTDKKIDAKNEAKKEPK